jgi:hypothetical protein
MSARDLLEALQGDDPELSEQTARRESLEFAAHLLALELFESIKQTAPALANQFLRDVIGMEEVDLVKRCEEVLDRSLTLKSQFEWGASDWTSPHPAEQAPMGDSESERE